MDSRLEFKTSPTSSSDIILLFVEVTRGRARVLFMYVIIERSADIFQRQTRRKKEE
jgi:hypothetical protein